MADWYDTPVEVKSLTDEELAFLHSRLKPVVKLNSLDEDTPDDGKFWTLKADYDLRKTAFIWDPTVDEGFPESDFQHLFSATLYARCNYIGFFKPSAAAVLAAVPKSLRNPNAAVWDPDFPGRPTHYRVDTDGVQCCRNGEQHAAIVHFYHHKGS